MKKIKIGVFISVGIFMNLVADINIPQIKERAAQVVDSDNFDIERYAIKGSDSYEEVLFKVYVNCSIGREIIKYRKKTDEQKKIAAKRYPYSMEIMIPYGDLLRREWDLFKFVLEVFPQIYVDNKRYHSILRTFFSDTILNFKRNIQDSDFGNSYFGYKINAYELFNCNKGDNIALIGKLQIMVDYWSMRQKNEKNRFKHQQMLEVNEIMQNLWNRALEVKLETALRKQRNKLVSEYEQKLLTLKNELLFGEENAKKKINKDIELNNNNKLDKFLNGLNSVEKIESIFRQISNRRSFARKYPNIPNYEELKKVFVDSNEADVLNLTYKYFMNTEKADTLLSKINKIPDFDDERILVMKVGCMQRTKSNYPTALKLVNRLLVKNPNKFKYKQMKLYLEHLLENPSD